MDITLFLTCFAKAIALFASAWLLVTLVAYTFNRVVDENHDEALAGATEFSFWLPLIGLLVLASGVKQSPASAEAGEATTIPFEVVAAGVTALIVYLCLSYLIKKRYEQQKS